MATRPFTGLWKTTEKIFFWIFQSFAIFLFGFHFTNKKKNLHYFFWILENKNYKQAKENHRDGSSVIGYNPDPRTLFSQAHSY